MATTLEQFETNYDAISVKISATLDAQITKLKEELDEYNILPETLAEIVSKARVQFALAIIQQSSSSSIEIINAEQNELLNNSNISLNSLNGNLINAKVETEVKTALGVISSTNLTDAKIQTEEATYLNIASSTAVNESNILVNSSTIDLNTANKLLATKKIDTESATELNIQSSTALNSVNASLVSGEIELNTRKIQGFDDNMLMELTKMQGNVASFFVNASPTGAQAVLDDLKAMMQTISQRATLITGTQPAIPS